MNSPKKGDRKVRSAEQKFIANFFEELTRACNIMDFELGGDGKNLPKFVQHDGYTYSCAIGEGKRLVFNIELKHPDEKKR